MEKVDLFNTHRKSRGTFDDFFNTRKYSSIYEAYKREDYVTADFMKDEKGVLFIVAYHVAKPDNKKSHRLIIQNPVCGLDVQDDKLGVECSVSLLGMSK